MTKMNAKGAVRWIAVLPGSIVAAVVGSSLVNIINPYAFAMAGRNPNGAYPKLFMLVASSFVLGYGFIWAGVKIAPSRKTVVAFVLGSLGLGICVVVLFMFIPRKDTIGILSTVLTLVFIVAAVAQTRESQKALSHLPTPASPAP